MDKKQKKEPGVKEWAIILAAGAFLLLLSVPDLFHKEKEETVETKATAEQTEVYPEEYAERMEKKLEKMILGIGGITEAKVIITVKSTTEKVVLQDTVSNTENLQESDGNGGSRSSLKQTEEKTAVLAGEKPYLTKELTPDILGVAAVVSGAGSGDVLAISEAVQALFGVPAHKVKIIQN